MRHFHQIWPLSSKFINPEKRGQKKKNSKPVCRKFVENPVFPRKNSNFSTVNRELVYTKKQTELTRKTLGLWAFFLDFYEE